MDFFEEKAKKTFFKISSKFRFEITSILVSAAILSASTLFFLKAQNPKAEIKFKNAEQLPSTEKKEEKKIYVDISGAIMEPDVYELSEGTRLKDLLASASGLSAEADRQFFKRYFNLARKVQDQEKIYIPSVSEVAEGLSTDKTTLQAEIASIQGVSTRIEGKININTATDVQLDTLPGVGKVTSQKIISGRPYNSVAELINKKIVGKATFNKIKDLITIN